MDIYFGPGFRGHPRPVMSSELRTLNSHQRALAFKARTYAYFINQVKPLAKRRGKCVLWSPFPLAILTCASIDMLGAYKYGNLTGKNAKIVKGGFKNYSKTHFHLLLEKDLDPTLSKKYPSPNGKTYSASHFLYKGFRHSIVHAFYGRWASITHTAREAKTWGYNAQWNFITVNVYWLWRRYREVADDYFKSLAQCTNPKKNPLRNFNKTFRENFKVWL